MSDKIVEAIKWKRLEDIFNLMDSDNDGVICNFFLIKKR
jgi:Ca2+-binding EF-hand superfamily protein